MRLCGISSHFWLLSPCMRQVTHALLTRPPLSHLTALPEGFAIRCFVRLACVKHAASVHPEPGSNSRYKFFLSQITLAIFSLLSAFSWSSPFGSLHSFAFFILWILYFFFEFSGMVFVLFSFQCSALPLLSDSGIRLFFFVSFAVFATARLY